MHLTISNLKSIIEEFAPIELKESYDNVGFMVGDLDAKVTSILVALDCTLEVIKEAKQNKCNLILTHHPLLFRKPSSITNQTLQGKKIICLIKNDINLYCCHTNLDSAQDGVNDTLMRILGFEDNYIIDKSNYKGNEKLNGIGRITQLKNEVSLSELCNHVKNALGLKNLRYCGHDNKVIKKIAVINGSGESYFDMAKSNGVDCIITGDTSYHPMSDMLEQGIAVIDAGHFMTEWPAIKNLAIRLKEKLNKNGFDNKIVISQLSMDPYKYK